LSTVDTTLVNGENTAFLTALPLLWMKDISKSLCNFSTLWLHLQCSDILERYGHPEEHG
jgi:hypothetical protein